MNILICGAGEVGRHTASILRENGEDITILDRDAARAQAIGLGLDVATFRGNATHAQDLREAGAAKADLVMGVTDSDETNLLCASLGKGLGAKKAIARVSHRAYLAGSGFDYDKHLGIDYLVCPDQATGNAIAETLRNPGALAIERFAQGRIEMQQISVSPDAYAADKPLLALPLSKSVRLASIQRRQTAFLPEAQTVIRAGDVVTLVGRREAFDKARRLFHNRQVKRKSVVIMGSSPVAVWLCRALRGKHFSIRMMVTDRPRGEELAAKLEWVNVVQCDPTDPDEFSEERIQDADIFLALTPTDEQNILVAARAKSMGVGTAMALQQRGTYLHLLKHVGIDQSFSPRVSAANEILSFLQPGPIRHLASLAMGVADIYEVQVPASATQVVGKPLKALNFPARSLVAAIQRKDGIDVPGADDTIEPGDTVIVIGRSESEPELRRLFNLRRAV